MTIVMVCVAISLFIVVLNERSTQLNADAQVARNTELTRELRCIRDVQFQAEKNEGEINIVLARALAALAQDHDEFLLQLVPELEEEADQLEHALETWSEALITCER